MPAWRSGQALGTWREIPGSALSLAPISVKAPGWTGPASKVIAWCGFAIDGRDSTVYCAANGGHMDYAGNEVNSIRLSDDAPKWIERRAGTPPSMILENASHYADGAPTSRHSYYGILFSQPRTRVMLLGGSRWGDGWGTLSFDGFASGTNGWDRAGSYPDVPRAAAGLLGFACVADEVPGDFYVFGNFGIFRWTSQTNEWDLISTNGPVYGYETAAALDTRRSRIVLLGGVADDFGLFTLGASNSERLAVANAARALIGGAGNGLGYDPWLDAYILRKAEAGSTVYRIDAQTFAVEVMHAPGGEAIPISINKVFRRFLFAPQLGGFVYCPSYTGNLWFLRTT